MQKNNAKLVDKALWENKNLDRMQLVDHFLIQWKNPVSSPDEPWRIIIILLKMEE